MSAALCKTNEKKASVPVSSSAHENRSVVWVLPDMGDHHFVFLECAHRWIGCLLIGTSIDF